MASKTPKLSKLGVSESGYLSLPESFVRDRDELRSILDVVLNYACDLISLDGGAAPVAPDLPRPACNDLLPEQGPGALDALLSYLDRYGPHHSRSAGPRYFGFVTGGVTPAALAADWLVSVLDQNVATERHSIAAAIEKRALEWVTELLKLPVGHFHGLCTSGATAANLVCLATAREWCGARLGQSYAETGLPDQDAIRVIGASPHSSIMKVMGILGLGHASIVKVETLQHREAVDPVALERALISCIAPGKIVIASAGTVDTGDFDDLVRIAELCTRHGAWLHVDGAFGAFARTSPGHAHLVRGLELADSITVDAHKWLNVPFDCGIAVTRHPALNEQAFGIYAPYVPNDGVMPSYMNRGVEQSRRFRALPLFLTLAAYGHSGIRNIVERNCGFAHDLHHWMTEGDLFEPAADCRLNVIAFRGLWPPGLDRSSCDRGFVERLNIDGRCFVTPSTYKGEFIIRLAVSNWQTDGDDLDITRAAFTEVHALLCSIFTATHVKEKSV